MAELALIDTQTGTRLLGNLGENPLCLLFLTYCFGCRFGSVTSHQSNRTSLLASLGAMAYVTRKPRYE